MSFSKSMIMKAGILALLVYAVWFGVRRFEGVLDRYHAWYQYAMGVHVIQQMFGDGSSLDRGFEQAKRDFAKPAIPLPPSHERARVSTFDDRFKQGVEQFDRKTQEDRREMDQQFPQPVPVQPQAPLAPSPQNPAVVQPAPAPLVPAVGEQWTHGDYAGMFAFLWHTGILPGLGVLALAIGLGSVWFRHRKQAVRKQVKQYLGDELD
jgi:hypothetical protein